MSVSTMIQPRGLVELGKIKIGTVGPERVSRKGNSFRPPIKLDHFLVTTNFRGGDGLLCLDSALLQDLTEEGYADDDGKIRRLPIALMSDDEDDVLQSRWVHYRGRTCAAWSDGETLQKFIDFKTGERLAETETVEWDDKYLDWEYQGVPGFKKHTVFNCVIASQKARWGGVYKFRTTSVITADQIVASLRQISALTNGVLAGVPLELIVRPMRVSPNGTTTTVYVVHVELRGESLTAIQERAAEIARLNYENRETVQRSRRALRQLIVQPGEETLQEASDVQDEFHPEETTDPLLGGDDDVDPSDAYVRLSERMAACDVDDLPPLCEETKLGCGDGELTQEERDSLLEYARQRLAGFEENSE